MSEVGRMLIVLGGIVVLVGLVLTLAPSVPWLGRLPGDILVLSSASVIKALLAADRVDRLALTVFPVFLGAGPRLFDDGLPTGQWSLVSQRAGDHGTLALVYDRVR